MHRVGLSWLFLVFYLQEDCHGQSNIGAQTRAPYSNSEARPAASP